MIVTEPGLTWEFHESGADNGAGGEYKEYRCVEHPRLTRLVQRPNRDADFSETYHVEGLVNYYHTPGEAYAAMRANP